MGNLLDYLICSIISSNPVSLNALCMFFRQRSMSRKYGFASFRAALVLMQNAVRRLCRAQCSGHHSRHFEMSRRHEVGFWYDSPAIGPGKSDILSISTAGMLGRNWPDLISMDRLIFANLSASCRTICTRLSSLELALSCLVTASRTVCFFSILRVVRSSSIMVSRSTCSPKWRSSECNEAAIHASSAISFVSAILRV